MKLSCPWVKLCFPSSPRGSEPRGLFPLLSLVYPASLSPELGHCPLSDCARLISSFGLRHYVNIVPFYRANSQKHPQSTQPFT